MDNFWQKLEKPILALAPMDDVTDAAFRKIIAKYGKPSVFFTEFVAADGLCSAGREALMRKLQFSADEQPVVAQLFGANPNNFYEAANLVAELGFAGIDINMGCPDKDVVKTGSGAALINNPTLAKEIIKETKRGAGKLPVSVKTRLGFDSITIDEWLPQILSAEPAAVILHGRTKKELSLVPAHWDEIGKAVELARKISPQTIILGNGDINSLGEAMMRARESGADGVMVGRGIFGNPWFFSGHQPSVEERLKVMVEHAILFEKIFEGRNFDVMRKHLKSYASGFDSSKELRIKLMAARNASEVTQVVRDFLERS